MVEINNQRKAFLDMLAWSGGAIADVRENRNHGYDAHYDETVTGAGHPHRLPSAK